MAKNKTKQAKFKEIIFNVNKQKFKKALNNVLLHLPLYLGNMNVLNGVKLHVESNYMEMTATDGNTLLKTTVELEDPIKGKADIVLNGIYLSKIKLVNSYMNEKRSFNVLEILEFSIKENEASITDCINGVMYKIPKIDAQYPPTEQLFIKYDEKEYLKIALNPNFIAKFKNLPEKNGFPLIMYFQKENPLAAVQVEANGGLGKGCGYKALIMPCQVRE